jgi:hypothetical protein
MKQLSKGFHLSLYLTCILIKQNIPAGHSAWEVLLMTAALH